MPRPLNPNTQGLVSCTITELQPEGVTTCDNSKGRVEVEEPTDPSTGRHRCLVTQLETSGGTIPTDPGWFYDDFTPETEATCAYRDDVSDDGTTIENRQRVQFTTGSEPAPGTIIRFECPAPIPPSDLDRGASCRSGINPVTNMPWCEKAGTAAKLSERYDYDYLSYCAEGTAPEACAYQPLICDQEPDVGTNTCQLFCTTSADCQRGFSCLTEKDVENASGAIERVPREQPICVVATCSNL